MQTKKIHFGAFSRFKPYLLRYPKEIIGALILGILSGFSTVLMTYYIGKSVDTMVGKGQVNAAQLIKILGLLAGILLVTVLSQWLIQRLGVLFIDHTAEKRCLCPFKSITVKLL